MSIRWKQFPETRNRETSQKHCIIHEEILFPETLSGNNVSFVYGRFKKVSLDGYPVDLELLNKDLYQAQIYIIILLLTFANKTTILKRSKLHSNIMVK